ncbi:hypothetical protein PGPR2_01720 [Pseudomonas aeruginosa PGPR2]|nr:hypothetical protein PGPR2_01720 [Pseudomonas aeruginosa PGPR2]
MFLTVWGNTQDRKARFIDQPADHGCFIHVLRTMLKFWSILLIPNMGSMIVLTVSGELPCLAATP